MNITPKREIELIAAAMVIDNDRGDGKFTCVHSLGYSDVKGNPAVLTAAHMLHDLCAAGNDPVKIFSEQIGEYYRMEEDGSLALFRAAVRDSKSARNKPCRCGSGKKYKQCCYWRDSLPEEIESKDRSKAGKILAALLTMLAAAMEPQDPRRQN